MNASSISIPDTDIIPDNVEDSDSDVNSDGVPEYYQPISSYPSDDDDDDDDDGDDDDDVDDDKHSISNGYLPSSNGHYHPSVDNAQSQVVDDEDDLELRRRADEDSAIRRAFFEHDSRRNAPLPSDNAARVIEAMRSVSLSGFAPDWANLVPEDRWLHQLQHIRHPPTSSSSPTL